LKRQRKTTPIAKRSQARMLALQALCAFEGVGERFGEQLDEFLCDELALRDLEFDIPPPAELVDFARSLALGAWAQRKLLDERLTRTTAHWSLSRMTPVDRNILRMGSHELLEHPETPVQVVINEAIELARRFGDADSPAFVNGVLDAIRRAYIVPEDSPTDASAEKRDKREADDGDGAV
jgi:N utilization substance protein B